MSTPDISRSIAAVKMAVGQFLNTVLGSEVPVELSPPAPAADLLKDASAVRILHPSVLSPDWYLYLDEAWVPLLSGHVIGEEMAPDQDGADDLLREVSTQAYNGIRRALEELQVSLPEFDMTVQGRDEAPPALSDTALAARITAEVEGTTASAWIVLRNGAFLIQQVQNERKPHVSDDVEVSPAGFPDLGPESLNSGDGALPNFELMAEVQLEVSVELGRRSIPLADLLRLTTGSVIELEKLVGEPLEVYANGRLIAEGEAVVIDEQFGIRITRLASVKQRARAFS